MDSSSIQWQIGCSGFHYKEWKKTFYPEDVPQRKWFEYYAGQFNCLELNVTFYRFPQLSFLQNWYAKSPVGFQFAVKVPRLITHYKKFEDTRQQLDDFYLTISNGLQEKLGAVLFQLPPDLVFSEQVLDKIVSQLNPSFKNVVEFRHASWWNDMVYATLAKNNICFCSHSYPKLPDTVIQTTDTVYYRFHGIPKLYYSSYSREFLQKVAVDIKKLTAVRQAWLFFNNTAELAAIRNARFLQKQLATVNS